MKFPLAPFFLRVPVPGRGGRLMRYRPVIRIGIVGPKAEVQTRVLVDTGADDIVFPWDIASQIGVDLTGAAQLTATGPTSSTPATLVFTPVILRLWDGHDSAWWRATVGFTRAPLRIALFGIAGGLEHFKTILTFSSRELELLPESSLPVTQDPVP